MTPTIEDGWPIEFMWGENTNTRNKNKG